MTNNPKKSKSEVIEEYNKVCAELGDLTACFEIKKRDLINTIVFLYNQSLTAKDHRGNLTAVLKGKDNDK